MSAAHVVQDALLWLVAVLWLSGFVAEHLRTPKPNRRLRAPDRACQRNSVESV